MVKCDLCNKEKDFNEFSENKNNYNGYNFSCKKCIKTINNKKWADRNKEKVSEYNKKWRNDNKEIVKENNKNRDKNELNKISKEWRLNNKEKVKENNKNWNINNKEKVKENNKKWITNNKEKFKVLKKSWNLNNKDKRNEYEKNRKNNDSLYKLTTGIRTLIANSIKKKGYIKESKTYEILGCSYEEFKIYLESKFENWMSWDNRGMYNGELMYGWDIDHVIPISLAKTEEELLKLNHYSNLQPLCSKINRDVKRNYSKLDHFLL